MLIIIEKEKLERFDQYLGDFTEHVDDIFGTQTVKEL